MVLFIDRNLGSIKIKEALAGYWDRVESHDDHFPPDTPDTEWLREIGGKKWVYVSKDRNIRLNPLELNALAIASVKSFTLRCKDCKIDSIIQALQAASPKMRQVILEQPGPVVYQIRNCGSLFKLYHRDDLMKKIALRAKKK